MKLLLADENFPYPSYKFLVEAGRDIKHIIDVEPSIQDESVVELAITEQRIILTFDSDFGDLIFRDGYRPPGVVYFRWQNYQPKYPGIFLDELISAGNLEFEGYLTVIGEERIRQRKLPG